MLTSVRVLVIIVGLNQQAIVKGGAITGDVAAYMYVELAFTKFHTLPLIDTPWVGLVAENVLKVRSATLSIGKEPGNQNTSPRARSQPVLRIMLSGGANI